MRVCVCMGGGGVGFASEASSLAPHPLPSQVLHSLVIYLRVQRPNKDNRKWRVVSSYYLSVNNVLVE